MPTRGSIPGRLGIFCVLCCTFSLRFSISGRQTLFPPPSPWYRSICCRRSRKGELPHEAYRLCPRPLRRVCRRAFYPLCPGVWGLAAPVRSVGAPCISRLCVRPDAPLCAGGLGGVLPAPLARPGSAVPRPVRLDLGLRRAVALLLRRHLAVGGLSGPSNSPVHLPSGLPLGPVRPDDRPRLSGRGRPVAVAAPGYSGGPAAAPAVLPGVASAPGIPGGLFS